MTKRPLLRPSLFAGRRLALKELPGDSRDREDGLRREFATFSAFHHPNLVEVHEFDVSQDRRLPFFTLEYIEGEDLVAAVRNEVRLQEFLALMAITSVLTAIGMVLVPAAGAYAHFNPASTDYSNFTSSAGMWHYTELMRLRSGEPFVYVAEQTKGLVTFPSFHTTLAVMFIYAFRGYRWIYPLSVALNTIMIVSTVPEGGHHVIDVLAGLGIAVVGILCVRLLDWGAVRVGSASPERRF